MIARAGASPSRLDREQHRSLAKPARAGIGGGRLAKRSIDDAPPPVRRRRLPVIGAGGGRPVAARDPHVGRPARAGGGGLGQPYRGRHAAPGSRPGAGAGAAGCRGGFGQRLSRAGAGADRRRTQPAGRQRHLRRCRRQPGRCPQGGGGAVFAGVAGPVAHGRSGSDGVPVLHQQRVFLGRRHPAARRRRQRQRAGRGCG